MIIWTLCGRFCVLMSPHYWSRNGWSSWLCFYMYFFIRDSNRERRRTNADLENKIRERRLPNVSPLGLHQWNKIKRALLILFHWWSPSGETFGNLRSLILFSKSAFVLLRSLLLSLMKKFYGFSRFYMYSTAKSALLCHLSHLHLSCTSAKKAFLGHWVVLCSPVEESSCGPF